MNVEEQQQLTQESQSITKSRVLTRLKWVEPILLPMTDLEKLRNDVLREMYAESEPPLDFDHVLENPEEYDDGWYDEHTLSSERQDEILDKHLDKHDLNDREHTSLVISTILDLGPANA